MRGARRLVPMAVLAAAIAGGCTDVNVGPNEAVALSFDSLPYPAIVAGDTLRDSLGIAAPLHAVAFGVSGDVLANPGIQYLALDTGLTLSASGVAVARARSGTARFVAQVSGIQSVARSLTIARQPDTVSATSATDTTVLFTIPDSASRNVSNPLSLRVSTRDTTGGVLTTSGWIVSYQVFFRGNALKASDTTVASLFDGASHVSPLDTTGADGLAARALRLRSLQLPTTPDSFVVLATVRYRGAAVRGSPVRFVIRTRPR